mmetsp:Transcript_27872/g.42877  ORF Transcript_27872/g.42877 Transcript_27872/m.42877 type:complete len:396 (-) Transcript_27872:63-1250(-)
MGNLLGAPITEKETESGQTTDGIPFAVSSMQGWRVHMEDTHICEKNVYAEEIDGQKTKKIPLPGHAVFAVFDGHGGTFAATYAGKHFCSVLRRQPMFCMYAQYYENRPKKKASASPTEWAAFVREGQEMLEKALQAAFIEIDREILIQVQKRGSEEEEEEESDSELQQAEGTDGPAGGDSDSGTTAVVVLLTPQNIICANAGDSRAIYSKMGHQAIPLSYDHKPDDEDEERRIRAAGGYVAAGRVQGDLAVSRGLGDFRFKDFDTVLGKNASLNPGDQKVSPVPDVIIQNRDEKDEFIVIACDGIWDVQTNYECIMTIAEMFEEGESKLDLVCEELLDICLRKGSKDNMTALIVKFDSQKIGTGGGVLKRREGRESNQEEGINDVGGLEKAILRS